MEVGRDELECTHIVLRGLLWSMPTFSFSEVRPPLLPLHTLLVQSRSCDAPMANVRYMRRANQLPPYLEPPFQPCSSTSSQVSPHRTDFPLQPSGAGPELGSLRIAHEPDRTADLQQQDGALSQTNTACMARNCTQIQPGRLFLLQVRNTSPRKSP